jgi:hypothetical protein
MDPRMLFTAGKRIVISARTVTLAYNWDDQQTRECKALYIRGVSTMAQTYSGSRNIVVVMRTQDLM